MKRTIMKKISCLFLCIFSIGMCSAQNSEKKNTKNSVSVPSTHVLIKVINANSDSVYINNFNRNSQDEFKGQYFVGKNGAIEIILNLTFRNDQSLSLNVHRWCDIWIEKGDSLICKFDLKDPKKPIITFDGKGAIVNRVNLELTNTYESALPDYYFSDYVKAKIPANNLTTKLLNTSELMINELNKVKSLVPYRYYNYKYFEYTTMIWEDIYRYPYALCHIVHKSTSIELLKNYLPDNYNQILDGFHQKLTREALYHINGNSALYSVLKYQVEREYGDSLLSMSVENRFMAYWDKSFKLSEDPLVSYALQFYVIMASLNTEKIMDSPAIMKKVDEFISIKRIEQMSIYIIKELAEKKKNKVGNLASPFTLMDLNGNKVSLSDFKDKVVFLDFWASWCGPCRMEIKVGMPILHEKLKDYKKDLVFIYISIDEKEDAWRKAIKDDNIEGIHLLIDKKNKQALIDDYGLGSYPHYYLIDKKGLIANPNAPWPSNPDCYDIIKNLLDKK